MPQIKVPQVNTIVIQTGEKEVIEPRIGQRVMMEGKPGTFIIVNINAREESADLVHTAGIHPVEEGVAFKALRQEPLSVVADVVEQFLQGIDEEPAPPRQTGKRRI